MKKGFIHEKLYQKIIGLLPIACVDLVIRNKNSSLLVKRKENPERNKWWFPGGRILLNESLKSAAKRKLREELNVKNFKKIEFLGVKETKFKKGRFGKPIYSINNVFLVELKEKEISNISPDRTISEFKWFNVIRKGLHPYLKKFLKSAGFK